MIAFFKITLFNPLYNLLLVLTNILPGGDLGLAIIILTILVKVIIFPLYTKSIKTQIKIKAVEAQLQEIKEKYKNNVQEQSKKTMELYREEKINPFSTFLVLLIQIPIIISLFYVFKSSFTINQEIIYSFVPIPKIINHNFLGLIDLTLNNNYLLSIITGLTQFLQVKFSLPKIDKGKQLGKSFKEDLARSMDLQMRYVMPVITIFIAFTLPSALALYWITSNIFSSIYELTVIKKLKKSSAKG